MNFLASFFLDFFYPPVCVKCGKQNKNWICEKCHNDIDKYKKNEYIRKVDKLEFSDGNKREYSKAYFDELMYIFEYRRVIRKLLIKYKFNDESYISHFFATEIFNNKKINEILSGYDIMMPVPMDKKKEKKRGYNQTTLVLKELIELHWKTIDIVQDNLIKIKTTNTQSTLNGIDRKYNIEGAYVVKRPYELKNKKIVVFDDIYTTGATANEIAKVLMLSGANKILIFTLAKD